MRLKSLGNHGKQGFDRKRQDISAVISVEKAVEIVHKILDMSKITELWKQYAKNVYSENPTFSEK